MADGDHTFTCVGCGAVFTAKTAGRKFCTRACMIKTGMPSPVRLAKVNCESCGALMTPQMNGYLRQRFCSRKCSASNQGRRERTRPFVVVTRFGHCAMCHTLFHRMHSLARFCSRACQYASTLDKAKKEIRSRPRPTKACKRCGSMFTVLLGHGAKRYCSELCAGEVAQQQRRSWRSLDQARRRGLVKDMYPIRVDPLMVFARDGWHCLICGIKTPKTLRGSYEHNAPEIDHIIPVSRGGSHAISNLRCLCRSCNLTKGSMLDSEMYQMLAA